MAETAQLLIRQGRAQFRDPLSGDRVEIPESGIDQALKDGLEPLSRRAVRVEELGGAKVGALEFGNALTFGALNAFRRGVLGTPQEDIAFQRQIEPEFATAGQVGGTIASFLLPGGAVARAGKVAQAFGKGTLGLTGARSAKIAGAIGEGVASGVGQELAQLSGERVSASEAARRIGKSAVVNAALTGTLGVVSAGVAGSEADWNNRRWTSKSSR